MSRQPPRRKAKPIEISALGKYDKMYVVKAPEGMKNGFFFDLASMFFGIIVDGQCTGIRLSPTEALGMAKQLERGAMLHEETGGLSSAPPAGSA